jgi:glc operon protein GlcG
VAANQAVVLLTIKRLIEDLAVGIEAAAAIVIAFAVILILFNVLPGLLRSWGRYGRETMTLILEARLRLDRWLALALELTLAAGTGNPARRQASGRFTAIRQMWNNGAVLTKFLLAAALMLTTALAQTPAPPAIVPYGSPISPDAAKKAAAAAIAEAKKNNWAMAIAIVDNAGYLVYFERMPDTQLASVEIAGKKAKSSALFRRPTKFFQDSVAAGGAGLRFLQMPEVIPVEGGFPIIVDGKVIGAIGASGGTSDQDALVATAGLNALK